MNVMNVLGSVFALCKILASIVLFQCAIATALSIGHIITAPFKKLLATMSKIKGTRK